MTLDKEELSWLTVARKFRRIVMKIYETLENKEGEHSGDDYLSCICDLDNDTDERMIIIMMVMMVVVMMPSHGYYLNSWDSWGEDLLSLHRWRNGRGLRKRMDWTRWTVKHDVSPGDVMPPCFFRRQLYCHTRVIGVIGQYWTIASTSNILGKLGILRFGICAGSHFEKTSSSACIQAVLLLSWTMRVSFRCINLSANASSPIYRVNPCHTLLLQGWVWTKAQRFWLRLRPGFHHSEARAFKLSTNDGRGCCVQLTDDARVV